MRPEYRRAGLLVLILAAIAIVGPWLAPYGPNEVFGMEAKRAQPPSLEHPFGTDATARDVLSRVLHGTRLSIGIAALAVGLALTLGTFIGVLSARAGGVLDTVLMRFTDAALAFPRLLILLLLAAGADGLSAGGFAIAIGATGWMNTARLTRAETLRLLATEHLRAARALGVPGSRIVTRHLLPALLPTLVAAGTIAFAAAIPLEAGLSFLGVGVQAPDASWGNIISQSESRIVRHWWMVLFPTVAIVGTVLAATSVAEHVGDQVARERR